jgi:nicotinate-nucleotide pyrophosphorylase (carboxylating)
VPQPSDGFHDAERSAAERLIRLALEEDLGTAGDVTTLSLVGAAETGAVQIVARKAGVLACVHVAELVFRLLDPSVSFAMHAADGDAVGAGRVVAEVSGSVRSLLIGERTALNFLTHLCGVATLTRHYVDAVSGTRAGIYDTRKTLPGWRILEKYAVRCGGGKNHRMGLFDQALIKDNHLADWAVSGAGHTIAAAIRRVREVHPELTIEVEVDTLDQLRDALSAKPHIVLLDNMSCDSLRQAVEFRDRTAPEVELEASGGVNLDTVGAIARTGVERISVGALTHSAPSLDLAFDWK